MTPRVAALALLAATALAACQGVVAPTPTPTPALTDPKAILAQSLASLASVKTFHLHADISGKFSTSLVTGLTGGGLGGLGGGSTPSAAPDASGSVLDISGTTLDADIDIPARNAHVAAAVPSLLGLTADYIQVGNDTYTKTSLTGAKYTKGTSPADSASSPASDPVAALATLKDELDKLQTPPQALPPEPCGDRQCYHVRLAVSQADAGASAAPTDLTGSATIDYFAATDSLRPDHVSIAVDGGTTGNLAINLSLSAYDRPVTITAPPADQVTTGPASIPGFSFPAPSTP